MEISPLNFRDSIFTPRVILFSPEAVENEFKNIQEYVRYLKIKTNGIEDFDILSESISINQNGEFNIMIFKDGPGYGIQYNYVNNNKGVSIVYGSKNQEFNQNMCEGLSILNSFKPQLF